MNMARTHIDKRSRLLGAAVDLAYQNGFGATSLADIAHEAEVPLGNVYYYFRIESQFRALGKGKDSNGLAVHLLSAMQGVSILAHTFHDSGLVAAETKRLKSWIRGL
jgi:hypothetical protein